MTQSTEKNLGEVHSYIRSLQNASKRKGNSDGEGQADVNLPKLEQLSKIIEDLNEKLSQKVLEVEQEHGINARQRMGLISNVGEAMGKGGAATAVTALPP